MKNLRKVNGLYVTECICFPRSGHHALTDLLLAYFGETLAYCEKYTDPGGVIDSCRTTNYQKNHDFELDTPIKRDRRYIVQIRDPIDALTSRWEFETRHGWWKDEEDEYRERMQHCSTYWAGFMNKWVFSPVPNRLVIRYREFQAHPARVLGKVIQFMTGQDFYSVVKLQDALEAHPVEKRETKPLLLCEVA